MNNIKNKIIKLKNMPREYFLFHVTEDSIDRVFFLTVFFALLSFILFLVVATLICSILF